MVFDPFLVVVVLMGEGRVDLIVGLTFPFAFSGYMANEEAAAPIFYLMGEEPLETDSSFALGGVGEIPFGLIGNSEDWKMVLPGTSDRVRS